jgi:hypothetical protein
MFPIWQVELLLENPIPLTIPLKSVGSYLMPSRILWISWLLGQLAEDFFGFIDFLVCWRAST